MTINEMMILKSEAETAFMAVLTVGKQASEQLARARQERDPVAESMAMAFGMTALQDAIRSNPQAVTVLMRMGGHKWGFKTDQDAWDGGGTTYKPDVVVPCFCEAMMNQLRPVGNEFNIITGSTYTTKEGWGGLLARLPGVTEVDARAGAIVDYEAREFETKKGAIKKKITASVSATADCKVWGQFVQVRSWNTPEADERLQLSVIASEIDEALDQLKGKADARILERLHQKVVALSLAGPQGVPQADAKRTVAKIEREPTRPSVASDRIEGERRGAEPDLTPAERDAIAWKKTYEAIQRRVKDPEQLEVINDAWMSIEECKDKEALREMYATISGWTKSIGKNNVDELHRWCAFCAEKLSGGVT